MEKYRPRTSFSNQRYKEKQSSLIARTLNPPHRHVHSSAALMATIPNEFGTATPKWTIPSSRKEQMIIENFPGPGYYQIHNSSLESVQSHLITERSEIPQENITANIDFFETRNFPEKPKIQIGTDNGQKFFLPFTESPGPGKYTPTFFKDTKIIKISKKAEERKVFNSPGPAEYDVNKSISAIEKRSPSYSFPKSKSKPNFVITDSPGPASYYPIMKRAPQWTKDKVLKSKSYQMKLMARDRPWAINSSPSLHIQVNNDSTKA